MAASWGGLLAGAGVTGVGDGTYPAQPVDCPGGRFEFSVCGNFGAGASVQLQKLGPDGVTWINLGTAVTQNGTQIVEVAPCQVQVVITGGTAPALFASLARVVQ